MPGIFLSPQKVPFPCFSTNLGITLPGFYLLKLLLKSASSQSVFIRRPLIYLSNVGDFENSKIGLKI